MKFVTCVGTSLLLISGSALASSHRESPNILNDPSADLTDVYSFKSTTNPNNQVFIMNVSPGYIGQAGPNWYMFDPNVLYELNIDTTGAGTETVTYQFRFSNNVAYKDGGASPDAHILTFSEGPVTFANNMFSGPLSQNYTVTKVTGGRRSGNATAITGSSASQTSFPVAPPRIGPFTTDGGNANKPSATNSVTTAASHTARYTAYKTLAANAIVSNPTGYQFFAGPRADPFWVDLGAVFDGVNIRPFNATGASVYADAPVNSLAGLNVLSIVFEVPVSELGTGQAQTNFGVWATTSRPQASVKDINGANGKVGGGWVQVQRLGNPLVNELVIGVQDKDKFGYTEPKDDVTNFASYVVGPELATVLNTLYGSSGVTAQNLISNIPATSRYDLVDVFVAGIPNFSQIPGATGSGDMLRVNRNLSLNSSYLEGWPLNGRKLTDNVVTTALQFLAGCEVLTQYANFNITGVTGFNSNAWSSTHTAAQGTVNCQLEDGAPAPTPSPGSPGVSNTVFPYEDVPFPAY